MKKAAIFLSAIVISLAVVLLASACGDGDEKNPFDVKSEILTAAERPVAMAFAPDGRLFYVEQLTGNIRVVNADGELLEEPFAEVDVITGPEWGLTGLALDPDFETNQYVYVYFTEPVLPDERIAKPVVLRFTDKANRGTARKVIVTDLPNTDPEHTFNASGSIGFDPEGFLYITLGDYDVELSQDLSIPQGKILRVDKEDGSAPPDNPFVDDADADPRIFAYGFREPFDFVFHPENGQIYGSDNNPGSCEELNVIRAGENYGWPDVGDFPWPDCSVGEQIKPIHFFAKENMEPGHWLSTVIVAGKEFVSGDVYPLLGDSLLVCETATKLLRRLVLTGPNFDQVVDDDVVVKDCQFDIAVSPDGIVYYSNGEEIRRLVPVEGQQPE